MKTSRLIQTIYAKGVKYKKHMRVSTGVNLNHSLKYIDLNCFHKKY